MDMARGGGNTSKLAVTPEEEAAFEDAASVEVDVHAERAQKAATVAAQRANADQYFVAHLRKQIQENMEANEVEADVDLSDAAMQKRLVGLRSLVRAGHKVNEIEREVTASGKSRLTVDGKLIAFEDADGVLKMIDDITAEALA